MRDRLAEGYHIFTAVANEDRGFEKVATLLEQRVKEAEKDFDMQFLSGPSYKDDSGSSRNVFYASQAAVLTRKKQ